MTQGTPIRFRISAQLMLCFDVLTLPDDGDLGAIDAERQERLFVRAIGLGGEGGVVGGLGDAPFSDIDGRDFVTKLVANAGNTATEPPESDNGNPLARRLLSIAP